MHERGSEWYLIPQTPSINKHNNDASFYGPKKLAKMNLLKWIIILFNNHLLTYL
jgi:hypothetical protein